MAKISVLIVIYQKPVITSSTYMGVINAKQENPNLTLQVWDNSPYSQSSEDLYVDKYTHTPENLPLSRIYNIFLSQGHSDIFCIFDDDTDLKIDYFRSVNRLTKNVPVGIPKIYHQGKLLSPLKDVFGWGRCFHDLASGTFVSNGLTFINSGLALHRSYVSKYAPIYDENLSFYGTDTQVAHDYWVRNPEIRILDVSLSHDLSYHNVSGNQRVDKLFEILKANYYILRRKSLMRAVVGGLIVFSVIVREYIKCRLRF